jgi:ABC-type Co2+ transport system permease subunit
VKLHLSSSDLKALGLGLITGAFGPLVVALLYYLVLRFIHR